ncbi:MAG: hypothetical protein ABIH83_02765 [Candidatus Micrarchaeota archaeon]
MAKSGNSKGKYKLKILSEELEKFNKLIEGHRKLLAAIGNL